MGKVTNIQKYQKLESMKENNFPNTFFSFHFFKYHIIEKY